MSCCRHITVRTPGFSFQFYSGHPKWLPLYFKYPLTNSGDTYPALQPAISVYEVQSFALPACLAEKKFKSCLEVDYLQRCPIKT